MANSYTLILKPDENQKSKFTPKWEGDVEPTIENGDELKIKCSFIVKNNIGINEYYGLSIGYADSESSLSKIDKINGQLLSDNISTKKTLDEDDKTKIIFYNAQSIKDTSDPVSFDERIVEWTLIYNSSYVDKPNEELYADFGDPRSGKVKIPVKNANK